MFLFSNNFISGTDYLGALTFETVVIDEAAQAVELSTLIPLQYKCKRCILVGDPNQLPATVMSQESQAYKYQQSLMERFFHCKTNICLLNGM